MTDGPFAHLSATALNLVHLRRHMGPLHAATAEMTEAEQKLLESMTPETLARMCGGFTAWAELRERSTSAPARGDIRFVEFSAGFSTRGLLFAENPEVQYLATDLDTIFDERLAVRNRLMQNVEGKLGIGIVDAINSQDVLYTRHFFDGGGPITLLNEGLFIHHTHENIFKIAQNFCMLLKRTGGVWYTPDIHTKEEVEHMLSFSGDYVGRLSQTNYRQNAFPSLDEAEAMMKRAGLLVTRHKQLDFVSQNEMLSSAPNAAVQKYLEYQNLWKMEPA